MQNRAQLFPQNHSLAVMWYCKADEQELAQAKYNLGGMFDNGYGVPKDYDRH